MEISSLIISIIYIDRFCKETASFPRLAAADSTRSADAVCAIGMPKQITAIEPHTASVSPSASAGEKKNREDVSCPPGRVR